MKQNPETSNVNSQSQFPNTERQEAGIIYRFSDYYFKHMGLFRVTNILIKHMVSTKYQY